MQGATTDLDMTPTGSPKIFLQILKNDLKDVELQEESVLVQYVDDLLLVSKDETACMIDIVHLCTALAEKGHHASPSKL